MSKTKVAIVGSGVSGLSAAWLLALNKDEFEVTIYEADSYPGGHTHTVDVPSLENPESKVGVDTGFIVFNPVTYPNFINFLKELNVAHERSDMTFSVSRNAGEFEWSGDNLDSVFAQRENMLPFTKGGWTVWRMLVDIIRFHYHAKKIAAEADKYQFDEDGNLKADSTNISELGFEYSKMNLGDFFKKYNYSREFQENYIIPMTAAIWSTPANMTIDHFPLVTLIRFMRNHVLLQIGGRPKWRTVTNGSQSYVKKVLQLVEDIRLNTPVTKIERSKDADSAARGQVRITDATGKTETFDHVVIATHTDQALKLLGDGATEGEKKIIGAVKYLDNRAVLHRDTKLMPKRRLAWSSWNYLTEMNQETRSQKLSLSYWMNRLQPFVDPKVYGEVVVTMNPLVEPAKDKVLGEWNYTHPLYTSDTIAAQDNLNSIQNKHCTTFAGAWTNYGFHEDGTTSGLLAAISLGAKCPFDVVLNGGYPTHRVPPPPPAWAKAKGVERYTPGKAVYVKENAPKTGFTAGELKAFGTLGVIAALGGVLAVFLGTFFA
ncbi:hypothetical protein BJ742DRAFT_788596 [Cladochytrium replicatum]|nr:hypothetical protein BJ742DRAFT_788596 [Cladochytrium replicatum]